MFSKVVISFLLIGIVTADEAPTCEVHETYETCGTACPLTCQNKDKGITCEDTCVEGCFCVEGYVKSTADGFCVPLDVCGKMPSTCEKNEVVYLCGSDCQNRTCQNMNEDINCSDVCLQGCFCEEGYVRSEEGGSCILPEDC